ncbi:copper oxidase [Lactobacillus sp. CBA3606]|uniref:multicopper oxidase family protein n=1 Tax=Lactobacillus sp. CBA3606 TaxID=2099789 RepID=UPI000CFD702E|nr:multicopper oxidase domain-containing protein [Lactobacillus sp. CBA3606]AVK64331.1 copper oxidase [Lactobacillus sp. CBA3606]
MAKKVYTDYFFDEPAYNTHDGGYIPLVTPQLAPQPLAIPPLLQPDKQTATDDYYTVKAETSETQFLPGKKTKTWGYNAGFLGQTIVFHNGKQTHIDLKNALPELTTFHWHGLNVPGPITDGGCHAPVYPGKTNHIDFKVMQPAATTWLHAHPCPSTATQVWKGLAAMVIIQDDVEAQLPLPRNYGVDDIPLVLQDREFHADNQFDYRADYDPDGVQGHTALINGTINPYFEVTTQRIRLRILNGSNRREWRLHFDDGLTFAQVGSDGGIMPAPVYLSKLMITCAERDEIVIDFGQYQPGDEVTLMSDETPLCHFRIKSFAPDNTTLPDHLVDIPDEAPTPGVPVRKITMDGMDEEVAMDGKKFDMERIDARQKVNDVVIWEITNTNSTKNGMVHPFHVHGTQFTVLARNDGPVYPNEHGLKDTVGVNPGETVRIKVKFDLTGVYMYHCHIIEHEDGGMMAQIESYDPDHPQTYHLMDMTTLRNAFAEEQGVKPEDVWMPGM